MNQKKSLAVVMLIPPVICSYIFDLPEHSILSKD